MSLRQRVGMMIGIWIEMIVGMEIGMDGEEMVHPKEMVLPSYIVVVDATVVDDGCLLDVDYVSLLMTTVFVMDLGRNCLMMYLLHHQHQQ